MLLFAVIFCVVVALGLGIAAALSDARGLIIPNAYPAGVLAAFVPAYGLFLLFGAGSGYFEMWYYSHLLAFAIVFAGSFLLFSFKLFGAGDSKLCSAYAIWTGLGGLSAFIFYMALVGGVLGVATLLLKKYKPFPAAEGTWLAKAQQGENAVPYGIAITAGAFISFLWMGYFSPDKLALLAGH